MTSVEQWGSELRLTTNQRASDKLKSLADPARRLLHDRSSNPDVPMGCHECPDLGHCGALNIEAGIWNCMDFCCGDSSDCDRVCRNNSNFTAQYNEVNGFDLSGVKEAPRLIYRPESTIIPTIYPASSRLVRVKSKTVCLRLSDLYSFKTGDTRFASAQDLRTAYSIEPGSDIILSGVDHDFRVEAWWKLGERRRSTIDKLIALGVKLVTTPNFSLILDRPRMDDLHSMKRIAIVHEEFSRHGLPAALHVNGRTDRDFERWTEYLVDRPNISQLAFEFSTGNGRADRWPLYVKWLNSIAEAIDWPLDLYLRGNPKPIPSLRKKFQNIYYIETTSFMRTTKRRRASRFGNRRIKWLKNSTLQGEDLGPLFEFNIEEQAAWISSTYFEDVA